MVETGRARWLKTATENVGVLVRSRGAPGKRGIHVGRRAHFNDDLARRPESPEVALLLANAGATARAAEFLREIGAAER